MKKQIIEQIRNKKNRNGVEQFLYMCEIAPKLNPQLDKIRTEILGHLVDVERHKQAQRNARTKAQKSYTDFALTPDFPMLLSHLVLSINADTDTHASIDTSSDTDANTHYSLHPKIAPPPAPSPYK